MDDPYEPQVGKKVIILEGPCKGKEGIIFQINGTQVVVKLSTWYQEKSGYIWRKGKLIYGTADSFSVECDEIPQQKP